MNDSNATKKQPPPRQVTVQPQEPKPPQGGPPAQPRQADKRPRRVAEGESDERNAQDRDGNE